MSPAGIETGVMHACGHDTHMTAWIGTAQQLAARKGDWSGTLVMILQPAEEIGEGAKAMLDDGLYTRFPKPDYVLAFHDAAQFPAGQIGYTKGFALANECRVMEICNPGQASEVLSVDMAMRARRRWMRQGVNCAARRLPSCCATVAQSVETPSLASARGAGDGAMNGGHLRRRCCIATIIW